MGREDVDGSADCTVAPVGCKDDDGSNSGLQSAMKICEALQKQQLGKYNIHEHLLGLRILLWKCSETS